MARDGSDGSEDGIGPAARSLRVLVVDDDPVLRRVARRSLQRAGHEVVEAADGGAAIAVFAREPARYDVVLLDHVMPGLSGDETVRALRAIHSDVRIVMVSGHERARAVAGFAATDAPGFVKKPYTVNELLAALWREVRR